MGECRVWAREARFDRFALYDVVTRVSLIPVKEEVGKGHAVVRTMGEGVQNIRVGFDAGEGGRKASMGTKKEGVSGDGTVVKVGFEAVREGKR